MLFGTMERSNRPPRKVQLPWYSAVSAIPRFWLTNVVCPCRANQPRSNADMPLVKTCGSMPPFSPRR